MGSQVCYAAEKQEVVTEIPQQIIVEGGVEFISVSTDAAQRVMRVQYRVYTRGDNLNVRSGLGTNCSMIGSFANGSLIDLLILNREMSITNGCMRRELTYTLGKQFLVT